MNIQKTTAVFFIFGLITVFTISAEKIVLITDSGWHEIIEQEMDDSPVTAFTNGIIDGIPFFNRSRIAVDGGRLERVIIDVNEGIPDYNVIISAVEASDADIVIFSPLLAGSVCSAAEMFPDRFFIIISGAGGPGCSQQNVSVFSYDFTDAYTDAGSWAAGLEEDTYAAFYTEDGRAGKTEISFLKGWTTVKQPEELIIYRFSGNDIKNPDFAASFTASVTDRDNIAAVFADRYSGTVLTAFDGSPVRVISEFLIPWNRASFNIAGSIELSTIGILSAIVKSVGAETYRSGGIIKAEFFSEEF